MEMTVLPLLCSALTDVQEPLTVSRKRRRKGRFSVMFPSVLL